MSRFSGLGLALEAPSRMGVIHPVTRQPLRDGDGKESWIDILSSGSGVGRTHDRLVTDQQLKMRNQRITAEQLESNITEKLAKLTRGWYLVTLDGAPIDVPFDTNAARELYALPELAWLRDQALAWAEDSGNFRQDASKNSLTTPSTNQRSSDGIQTAPASASI